MSKKSSDSTGDKVKKQESKYDANVLRDLIRNGKTASEIMLAMGISHKQILKHHILKLIATDKEFYEVPGLYDKNRRKAFVNSRGEIRLRMPNIDLALPGFPWVADLLMSFPEGTNEGYGPIFSDSRADRALVC